MLVIFGAWLGVVAEAGPGDRDGDGLDDAVEALVGTNPDEPDSDFDGVDDATEVGSVDAPLNTDGDSMIDALDDDDDDDGVPTVHEEVAGSSRLDVDSDGDGISDGREWLNHLVLDGQVDCESADCLDEDGGTSGLALDDPWDRDADGLIDALDPDDDGDGLSTVIEGEADQECVGNPRDGIPNYLDRDSDGDGILDKDERPAAADSDLDGLADRLDCLDDGPDGDQDGDGLPNARETEITGRFDAQASPDYDGDLIPDAVEVGDERCMARTGPCTPTDTDGDGLPDMNDRDDDGDAFSTFLELGLCPGGAPPTLAALDPWELRCGAAVYVPRNTDAPIGKWFPLEPDDAPDYLDDDDDGDRISSFLEGAGDADGDGVPNFLDPVDIDGPAADADDDGLDNATEARLGTRPYDDDSDADGLSDAVEVGDPLAPLDSDEDRVLDALDEDDDDDTLPTRAEGPFDADLDGLPNHLDLDSDDDGTEDGLEGFTDADCDGIVDVWDPADADGPCADSGVTFRDPPVYTRQGCAPPIPFPLGAGGIALALLVAMSRRKRYCGRAGALEEEAPS